MSRRRVRALLPAFSIALACGAVTACGAGTGKVAETNDGRVRVSGTGSRTKATITGDGSTVTYGTGSVPAGFPESVPRPAGARLGTTAAGARGGTRYFELNYVTGGSASRVLDAYGRQLTDAGFTVTPGPGATVDATHDGGKVHAVAVPGSSRGVVLTVTNA